MARDSGGQLGARRRRRQPREGRGRDADRLLGIGRAREQPRSGARRRATVRATAHRPPGSGQFQRRLPLGRAVRAERRPVDHRHARGRLDHLHQTADAGPLREPGVEGREIDREPVLGDRPPDQRRRRVPLRPRQPGEHHPALGAATPGLQPFAQDRPDPGERRICHPAGWLAAHPSTTCSRWPSQGWRYCAMPRSFGSRSAS